MFYCQLKVVSLLPDGEKGFQKLKHYLSASLLTTVAGLITFPVLTRLLSKADYGTFSLIQGFQLIYEAILKGGGQFSVVRFYPSEYLDSDKSKTKFISNLIFIPLLLSSLVTLFVGVGIVIYSYFYSESYIALLVLIAAQSSIILSYFRSYMQASNLSKYDALIDITSKYLYLICVIPIVLYLFTSYWGVYWAIAISAFAVSCISIWVNRGIFKYMSFNIDKTLIRASLKYSIPLLMTEISILSISYSDRFIMAAMDIEMSDIGIYAIGFGLANVVFMLVWKVLQPAVLPNVNRLHDCISIVSATNHLKNVINLLMLLFFSLITGIALNYNDFIILLCGEDKADAGIVFLLATLLFLIKIISILYFYGLNLFKNTKNILYSELIIAVCNIVLNVVLIPHYGIYGAMAASYISVFIGMSLKYIALHDDYRFALDLSGIRNVTIMLAIYSTCHIYIIRELTSSHTLTLIYSALLFLFLFYFIRKPIIKKIHTCFDFS